MEALTPSVTVFGDRASREVIRVNEVMRVGPSSHRTGVLVRRVRDSRALSPRMHREEAT